MRTTQITRVKECSRDDETTGNLTVVLVAGIATPYGGQVPRRGTVPFREVGAVVHRARRSPRGGVDDRRQFDDGRSGQTKPLLPVDCPSNRRRRPLADWIPSAGAKRSVSTDEPPLIGERRRRLLPLKKN
jgi:hypothetical protein